MLFFLSGSLFNVSLLLLAPSYPSHFNRSFVSLGNTLTSEIRYSNLPDHTFTTVTIYILCVILWLSFSSIASKLHEDRDQIFFSFLAHS